MKRCVWAENDPLNIKYHDTEWGVPLFDDERHFEYLSLEALQCGLSWITIIRKREALNKAFDGFKPAVVASYTEDDVERILSAEGVIRSEQKIRAIISNAKCFLAVQQEYISFSSYIWSFTDGKVMNYPGHADGSVVVSRNELSDEISKCLKRRGFKYLGPVAVYSYLQASGIINDHMDYCFRYKELNGGNISTL